MRALLVLSLCLIPVLGFAQVQPAGSNFTPGHTVRAMNSQGTVIGDAGGAAGSKTVGQGYLTELGITNSGTPLCVNDALTTGPYHQLCLGAGGTGITYTALGGASQLPLQCVINGVTTNCVGATTVGSVILTGPGTAYTNSNPAAVVAHISDRLLIGNNTQQYNGNSEGLLSIPLCSSPPGSGCSWVGSTQTLTGVYSYLEREGQLLSYSQTGEPSAFFASRTSDVVTHGQTCCTVGMASFVYNDAAGTVPSWGTYNTNVRASGAGTTLGTEWDIGNLGAYVEWHPFLGNGPVGITVPVWVACGGELNTTNLAASLNPCTAAIGIVNNGQTFDKGISFGNNALTNHSGIYHVLEVPTGGAMEWWSNNGGSPAIVSSILSNVSGVATANFLNFTDTGAQFTGPLNSTDLLVSNSPSNAVNYVQISPAATTNAPTVQTLGTDTNISLSLVGKGTGNVILNAAQALFRVYTVSTLPTCGTVANPVGTAVAVSDANSTTFDSALAGSGTNAMIAFCGTGNTWRAH